MGLTPSPVNAWPLAWIALVPLWVLVVEEGQKTPLLGGKSSEKKGKKLRSIGSLLLLPLLWGIGYHGLALFWITGIHPMTWLGVPWLASLAIAIFCWVFITLWGAALVTVWVWLCTWGLGSHLKWQISPFVRLFVGTVLWCSLEAIWSSGNLWWTALAYTQSPHNLAILHLGQLSGPTAVTAAIVSVNGLIAEAWINVKNQPKKDKRETLLLFISPIILFLSLHAVGFGLYSRPLAQSPEMALKVGIVQGNIPNALKFGSEGWRRALAGYTKGYNELADRGVDAVLIPETALPYVWTEDNRRFSEFYQAILERKVVAWVGTFGSQGNNFTNSLLTVTGTGETLSRYDKTKLVPLGEYIPFEEVLGRIVDKLSPLDAQLVAGTSEQIFETPFGRAIAGICYDSAFSELFRRQAAAGGQFILSASNDAHYTAAMMLQHHAQDVMRAIETDRWAVRATNTGYSAIVDPHGRTLWISQMNTYELHADTIYRRQTKTPYVRWGDWLLPILWVAAAIAWVVNWRSAIAR